MHIHPSFRSVAFGVVTCLTLGCSTGPTRAFVKTNTDKETRLKEIRKVSILADVTVLRDVTTGDKYWSVLDSRSAEKGILEGARAYLVQKGYQVTAAEAPFVGAALEAKEKFKVASKEDAPIFEASAPIDRSPQGADPALVPLIAEARKAALVNATDATCCTQTALREALVRNARRSGADAVLVVVGSGVVVPTGKSVVQGTATAVVTTILTLGMFTYSQWDVSSFDTWVALIDAQSGAVLWSNALRLKGSGFTEKDYYAQTWGENLLFHLPDGVRKMPAGNRAIASEKR